MLVFIPSGGGWVVRSASGSGWIYECHHNEFLAAVGAITGGDSMAGRCYLVGVFIRYSRLQVRYRLPPPSSRPRQAVACSQLGTSLQRRYGAFQILFGQGETGRDHARRPCVGVAIPVVGNVRGRRCSPIETSGSRFAWRQEGVPDPLPGGSAPIERFCLYRESTFKHSRFLITNLLKRREKKKE
jgi:hypothetical protein